MSPSQSRKHRGYKTQDLIATALRELYPYADSTGAGRQGKDITNTPGVSIEVKARTGFSPLSAMRQAKDNTGAGEIPIVILRMDGQGPASVDQFLAILEFGTLRELLRRAGYGDPPPETPAPALQVRKLVAPMVITSEDVADYVGLGRSQCGPGCAFYFGPVSGTDKCPVHDEVAA